MANSSTDINKSVSAEAGQAAEVGTLRSRREFLYVQHNGVRQVMPHFILQAAIPDARPGSPSAHSSTRHIRTGLTASKKVGNAVLRNRAKRRMRVLMAQLGQMQTPCRADYVLVARHSLTSADWPTLCAEFTTAAERVNRKLLAEDDQERAL